MRRMLDGLQHLAFCGCHTPADLPLLLRLRFDRRRLLSWGRLLSWRHGFLCLLALLPGPLAGGRCSFRHAWEWSAAVRVSAKSDDRRVVVSAMSETECAMIEGRGRGRNMATCNSRCMASHALTFAIPLHLPVPIHLMGMPSNVIRPVECSVRAPPVACPACDWSCSAFKLHSVYVSCRT